MGCRPARAAPTAIPQKPASVMGVSITRLGPKRSSRPLVTLYLHGRKVSVGFASTRTSRVTHAPLYCATSSPRTKVFWLSSNSSAKASFKASRTVTCLVPFSVAYPRRRIEGAQAVWRRFERRAVEARREENRRAVGRKSRGADIAEIWGGIEKMKTKKKGKVFN